MFFLFSTQCKMAATMGFAHKTNRFWANHRKGSSEQTNNNKRTKHDWWSIDHQGSMDHDWSIHQYDWWSIINRWRSIVAVLRHHRQYDWRWSIIYWWRSIVAVLQHHETTIATKRWRGQTTTTNERRWRRTRMNNENERQRERRTRTTTTNDDDKGGDDKRRRRRWHLLSPTGRKR
jgi:hypothetical protein